jgi:hypothetical protein
VNYLLNMFSGFRARVGNMNVGISRSAEATPAERLLRNYGPEKLPALPANLNCWKTQHGRNVWLHSAVIGSSATSLPVPDCRLARDEHKQEVY